MRIYGMDHVGFNVPDMAEAVTFFTDVLGCHLIYQKGPFKDEQGNWMADQLAVHPRSEIRILSILRCGHGSNFELFEYHSPDDDPQRPRNHDAGGHHLAFYVDDIDQGVAYLKEHGLRILGDIVHMEEGPSKGLSWVYFLSPWGMTLELVSAPQGQAYEANASVKAWHPRHPQS